MTYRLIITLSKLLIPGGIQVENPLTPSLWLIVIVSLLFQSIWMEEKEMELL